MLNTSIIKCSGCILENQQNVNKTCCQLAGFKNFNIDSNIELRTL